MLPFCGYNIADYWAHWLEVGAGLTHPPRVFGVNWFRTDSEGCYLWPGFGENMRVIRWIVDRCRDEASAVDTPIGFVPTEGAIDCSNLPNSEDTLRQLLTVDPAAWRSVVEDQQEYLQKFGSRVPPALWEELESLRRRLSRLG